MIPQGVAKWLLLAIGLLAMIAIITGLGVYGLATIDGMIERAAKTAGAERDHYWRGQIDQANAAVALKEAELARAAMIADARANDRIREMEADLEKRKRESAALPNGDACGLSRDRVRLLPD